MTVVDCKAMQNDATGEPSKACQIDCHGSIRRMRERQHGNMSAAERLVLHDIWSMSNLKI